jgi:hypothetical protein
VVAGANPVMDSFATRGEMTWAERCCPIYLGACRTVVKASLGGECRWTRKRERQSSSLFFFKLPLIPLTTPLSSKGEEGGMGRGVDEGGDCLFTLIGDRR